MPGVRGTVLILEDDPGIARLERMRLERAGYAVKTAATPEEAMELLAKDGIDLVVLDYQLQGNYTGLDFYKQIQAAGYTLPAILVTGFSDENKLIQAIRAGMRDFVPKTPNYLEDLPPAVERVMNQVHMERQLKSFEARLAGIITSAMDAIVTTDGEGGVTLFNPAAEEVFGCSSQAAAGRHIREFIDDWDSIISRNESAAGGKRLLRFESQGRRCDGACFPIEVSLSAQVEGQDSFTLLVRDVSERRRAEEERAQLIREQAARAEAEATNQKVRTLLESISDAFVAMDTDWRYTYVNHTALRLMNMSRESLIGRSLWEVFPDLRGTVFEGRFRQAMESGQPVHFEERFEPKGTWLECHCYPSPDGLSIFFRDTTARRRAEEHLRYQLDLTKSITDNAAEALFMMDRQGRVTFVNPAAEKTYGWKQEELLGQTLHDRLHHHYPDGRPFPMDQCPLRAALVTGRTIRSHEDTFFCRDGTPIPVVCSHAPIMVNGEVTGAVLVVHDISERKRAEEERARLARQLAQAQRLESVGLLAGGIAHNFNNLLAVIMGNASLFVEDVRLPGDVRHAMKDILSASERGADLARELLAYARSNVPAHAEADVNAVAQSVAQLLNRMKPPHIDLVLQLASGLPPVQADPSQIDQVLMNLCLNAIQASKGPGTIHLTTSLQPLSGEQAAKLQLAPGVYIHVEIRDQGSGMDQKTLDRIFEPFFTTKNLGQGLGLSSVLGIVQSHGGQIRIASTLGVGTTVRIWLPASISSSPAEAAVHPYPKARVG